MTNFRYLALSNLSHMLPWVLVPPPSHGICTSMLLRDHVCHVGMRARRISTSDVDLGHQVESSDHEVLSVISPFHGFVTSLNS